MNALVHLITITKGRLHHLRQTLPAMLAQECDFDYRVVVIDYGSPDGEFDWCIGSLGDTTRSVLIARVLDDTEEFSRSRSRNIGGNLAVEGFVAFVDVDALLSPHWLESAVRPLWQGKAAITTPDWSRSITPGEKGLGLCAVKAETFHAVRGFDEALRGWGYEDNDFWLRCQTFGPAAHSDGAQVQILAHELEQRVRFHAIKDLRTARQANKQRVAQRLGPVNPAGYGLARLQLWSNRGEQS